MTFKTWQWILRGLTWDGLLPLLIAGAPFGLKMLIGPIGGWDLVVVIFLPLLMALIRSQVAWFQLQGLCQKNISLDRQLLMAIAIILLLCFEITANLITVVQGAPAGLWYYALGFYASYLVLIFAALRPE